MEAQNRSANLQRNPKTHAEHRREVFWQITLPMMLGILLLLAALAAIIVSTTQPVTDVRRWADVSLMWMILPSLFFALIFLILLIGFGYAISYLLRSVPHYAQIIQLYLELVKDKVSQISNISVEPIIRVNSLWSIVRWVGRRGKPPAQEG